VVLNNQNDTLSGVKLLLVQPMTSAREPLGRVIVAADSVGAGVGEVVFFVRGKKRAFRSIQSRFLPTPASSASSIPGTSDRPMLIARVTGTLVATQKNRKLEGAKLLFVQPLTLEDTPRGPELLAVDGVGAGVHEKVLIVLEGRAASDAIGKKAAPVDAAIVGIVDTVDLP
jgi:ethanolamine utilization protein EutN